MVVGASGPGSPGGRTAWRVERQTASQRVVARVKELIAAGEFAPGERLPSERELAEMLGVSRPSLREALQALAALRLIDIRHGEGVYVTSLEMDVLLQPLHFVLTLDETAVEQIFETRRVVESGTARLAAENATAEAVADLERLLAELEQALSDPDVFYELDLEFHDAVTRAAANPFLTICVKSLDELGKAARRFVCGVPELLPHALDDHRRIAEAVAAGDGEAAATAMDDHLRSVLSAWQEAQQEQPSGGSAN